MLKGQLCSKVIADEADFAASLNTGSLKAEKGFCTAKISASQLGLKEESGKCNTCVHSEETAAIATKTNGFSGKACQKKDSNVCSFNDTGLLFPRENSPCGGHHRSSETSHPPSECLSHESSENTESEETCWGFHTSEGTTKIIKSNLHPTCANKSAPLKAPIFHDKAVSDQLEKQDSECLGDNISFICGSEYSKTRAGDRKSEANKKNASYNSALIDSFSETEKTVKGQDASCCLDGSPCSKRSNRSFNKCSQEILCCSNKSDVSEISSLRGSCAGASSAKGEHSDCSVEQVPSSFARADAVQVGSQIGGEHNSADSMQVDTGINEREQTAEVKSTTVVKKVHMEETTVRSWPVACSDGSNSIEYDVKVCDICGDIGREELLAVCSRCNDGAEHIYCMRVKMDSVPKGDWTCEECVLSSKHNENRKQGQVEGVKILKRSYTLESETKGLEFEDRKAAKVSSIPPFSSKRPASGIQSVRQRPVGTVLESPSTYSSRRKTSTHHSGSHSCSTTTKTVCIPTESSRSPKLPSQSQVSKGFFLKSKSFSARSLKEDVQLLKKGSCRNEGLVKETAANESKGGVQIISKSASLKNMKSYSVNNSNRDHKLPSSFSHGEDLKVSRQPKEQYSTNTEKKLRLANSGTLSSMADKRSASTGKSRLTHSSSSSCKDLRAEKGHEISNNSLKRSDHSAQGASADDEKKRVVNARKHVECPAAVVPATSTKHSDTNAHSDEHHSPRDCYMFASEVHVPSWISAIPQLDSTWQAEKGHEISNNSLKRSDHSAQGASADDEKKRVVNARQHVECPAAVVPATGTKHSDTNVHSDEHHRPRDCYMFASEVHVPSWISAIPQLDSTWQAEKGHEISNNSLKRSDHSAQGASADDEKKRVVNARQHVECPAAVVPATSTKHSDTNVHSDEHHRPRDCYMFASEVHVPSWISAIPQLDSTWQGKFEIQRSGGLSFTCDGMQAHLSTYASDKVLQLVPKLTPNLLLEEAPRETMWPTQFMKNHATEDNIALYFFAKDLDSYEGSYKNLLDRMIKNDFSLKWNFGGVELLIFTSNLLPEKSQRWNNLLFLWGVFRGKMVHSSRQIPVVPASDNTLPLGKSSQSISASLVSCNTQETLNSNTLLDSKAVTSGRAVEVCETKASSLEQKPPDLQTTCSQQVRIVDDQIKNEQFSGADTYQSEERVSKRRLEIDLNCSLQESPEYSTGHTEADGLSGMNVGNNSITDINERCSVAINDEGPSISGEFKCDGAHNMSIVSPQKYRWKPLQQQVLQNDGGNQRNGSDQGNVPHFLKLTGGKDVRDETSGREASGDTNPSLALSLALPFPKTSESKLPEWPEVKTTLSLF